MKLSHQTIKETQSGTIHLISDNKPDGGYYLLSVPEEKSSIFEAAIWQGCVRLQQYGRLLHQGTGIPSADRIRQQIENGELKIAS